MLAAPRSLTRPMVAVLCTLALAACDRTNASERPAAPATGRTHVDSSAGEVSQYSLMTNTVGWLTDSNIVSLVDMVNQAPVNLAKTESQAWTDEQVHGYAMQIIHDHAALQFSIDSLIAKHRIPPQEPAVAESMRSQYDSIVSQLNGLPASEVDKRFLALEEQVHNRTVIDFGALGGNASDPDLRAMLAIRATEMERAHLARARDLTKSVASADSAKQVAKDSSRAGHRGR
jgi:putative membrane protein